MGASLTSKTDVQDDRSTHTTGQRVDSGNRSHMQPIANVNKGSSSVDASYAGKVKSTSPLNLQEAKSELVVQGQSNRHIAPHSAGATPGVHKPTPAVASSEQNTCPVESITIPLGDLPCESVEALFVALATLKNDLPSFKADIPKLLNAIKDNEILQEKVKELERSIEATKKAKDYDRNTFVTKYNDLKSSEESTKKKYNDSLKDLAEANKSNTEFAAEVKRLMVNERSLMLENQRLRKELEDSRQSSEKVCKELSECKSRLSKLLSNKLTENNPQIADLSDTNRPTKLGEKHSELYDNQWTNAFEVLEKDFENEEKTIQDLLNMYLGVYMFCKKKAGEQIDQLKQVAYMWGSETKKADSLELKTQVKEFRKYTAELSVKGIFQEYIQKHVAKDYMNIVTKPEISEYVEACVKVCWLMNAQDPPVVIAALPQTESKFNIELYKPYTQGGDRVEYLVWPALLLHDGGSTLVRGVAQGYKFGKPRHTADNPKSEVPTTEHEAQGHNLPDPHYTHSASSGLAGISCQQGEHGNNTPFPMDTSTGQADISSHQGQNWDNTQYQMDAPTGQAGISSHRGQHFNNTQYQLDASTGQAGISSHRGQHLNNTQYQLDASTGQAGISSHRGQNWNNTQYQMDASTGQAGTGHTMPYSQNAMSASAGQTDVSGHQGQNRTNTMYANASETGQVGAYSQQQCYQQYAQQANATSPTPSNIGLQSSSYDAPRSAAYSIPMQPISSTTMHGGLGSTDLGKSSERPTEAEWQTFKTLLQTEGEQKCILKMGIVSYKRCEQYYIENCT